MTCLPFCSHQKALLRLVIKFYELNEVEVFDVLYKFEKIQSGVPYYDNGKSVLLFSKVITKYDVLVGRFPLGLVQMKEDKNT